MNCSIYEIYPNSLHVSIPAVEGLLSPRPSPMDEYPAISVTAIEIFPHTSAVCNEIDKKIFSIHLLFPLVGAEVAAAAAATRLL